MQETAIKLLESKLPSFLAKFGSEIEEASDHRGDLIIVVKPQRICEVISFLKTDSALPFQVMMDLFAVDYLKWDPPTPERYAVIYNLYSITHYRRVQIKAYVSEEKPEIDSIHEVYMAANWFEREAWDLFGVVFKGHPHLLRILCHDEFVGHPLRKDYPSDQYQRLKNAAPPTGF